MNSLRSRVEFATYSPHIDAFLCFSKVLVSRMDQFGELFFKTLEEELVCRSAATSVFEAKPALLIVGQLLWLLHVGLLYLL